MIRAISYTVSLALCLVSGSVRAQPESPPAWARWEQRVHRMDLQPEQKQKVAKILDESRKEREGITALIRQAAIELNDLLEQPSAKEQAILKQADRLSELRMERQKAMLKALLKVRAELTPEQRQQLFAKQAPSNPKESRRQPSAAPATPAATPAATP